MPSATTAYGTVGLAFAGWVLMLAGIGKLQVCAAPPPVASSLHSLHSMKTLLTCIALQIQLSGAEVESFRNYPIVGTQDKSLGVGILGAALRPFIGVAFSYAWWMMSFQLVVGVLLAGAAVSKPAIRGGAVQLLGVLTTATFLLTNDTCNAVYGAYATSHNANGEPASVIGTHASHVSNAMFTFFAGLVVVDVANALTLFLLGCGVEAAAPKAAAAAPVEQTPEAPAAATEAV